MPGQRHPNGREVDLFIGAITRWRDDGPVEWSRQFQQRSGRRSIESNFVRETRRQISQRVPHSAKPDRKSEDRQMAISYVGTFRQVWRLLVVPRPSNWSVICCSNHKRTDASSEAVRCFSGWLLTTQTRNMLINNELCL